MSTLSTRGEYLITTDKTRFDIEAIHAFLTQSYRSPGIPIMLATRDEHKVHKQFGYTELADPSRLMERYGPTVYTRDTERAR